MPENQKPLFYPVRDQVVEQLNGIPYPEVIDTIEADISGQEISELITE